MISIEDSLDIYLREVGRYPILTREEEQALFKRLRQGDEKAREEIVRCNLRFVVKMALRYQGQGVSLPDLIQEGNMGLLEVVDKFDHRKGFRFSTYAAFWIKQSIQQALCKQSRLIRLPIRKSRMIGRINEAAKSFTKRYGREPNADEIAEMVNLPPERVEQLEQLSEPALSLDSAADPDSPPLEDLLAQKGNPDPREHAVQQQLKRRVQRVIRRLSDRERRVLLLRYGFNGKKSLSLRNTSIHVGLSQEGVRRVERRALKKLRLPPFEPQIAGLL